VPIRDRRVPKQTILPQPPAGWFDVTYSVGIDGNLAKPSHFLAMLVCVSVTSCGHVNIPGPSQSTLPLFDAFKSFCVETGAKPEVVNATVEAAGGKLHMPSVDTTKGRDSMDSPFPLTLTTWDITLKGHPMWVSSGTSYPSRKLGSAKNRVSDFDSCDISSFANEDASIEAIRRWANVEPNEVSTNPPSAKWSPSLTMYFYSFQVSGSVHSAIADKGQILKAEEEGRFWSLVIMQNSHSAAFQLVHDLPRPK
jgi:hypothetical protein